MAENHGRFSIVTELFRHCLSEEAWSTSIAPKAVTKSSKSTADLVGQDVAGVRLQTGMGNEGFVLFMEMYHNCTTRDRKRETRVTVHPYL